MGNWMGSENILATSLASHFCGAHPISELVMLSRPVVHWHVVSVTLQPESGSAATKQGSWTSRRISTRIPICSDDQTWSQETYSTRRYPRQILRADESQRRRERNNGSLEMHGGASSSDRSVRRYMYKQSFKRYTDQNLLDAPIRNNTG